MVNADSYPQVELAQQSTIQSTIQVTNDIQNIPQVLDWFSQFHQSSVPQEVWLQCQLALIEGFTNAVRHGNRGLPQETVIDVEVRLLSHGMEIRIWDNGPGFDLNENLRNASRSVNQESSGGRGLLLMSRIADELDYTRTSEGRNCLLLVKRY